MFIRCIKFVLIIKRVLEFPGDFSLRHIRRWPTGRLDQGSRALRRVALIGSVDAWFHAAPGDAVEMLRPQIAVVGQEFPAHMVVAGRAVDDDPRVVRKPGVFRVFSAGKLHVLNVDYG